MLSKALVLSALPGSSLRSTSPRVTASRSSPPGRVDHLRKQVGRLRRLQGPQLGRHRHQRAVVALLEHRLHVRQREIATRAHHRARGRRPHVGG